MNNFLTRKSHYGLLVCLLHCHLYTHWITQKFCLQLKRMTSSFWNVFCRVTNPLGDSTSHRAHNPKTTCRSYLGKALLCTPAVDGGCQLHNLESTWYCFILWFDACRSVPLSTNFVCKAIFFNHSHQLQAVKSTPGRSLNACTTSIVHAKHKSRIMDHGSLSSPLRFKHKEKCHKNNSQNLTSWNQMKSSSPTTVCICITKSWPVVHHCIPTPCFKGGLKLNVSGVQPQS